MMDLSLSTDPHRSSYPPRPPPPSRLASDSSSAHHLRASLPHPAAQHSFLPFSSADHLPFPHPLSSSPSPSSWITHSSADAASASAHLLPQHYSLYAYGAEGHAFAPIHASVASWTPEQLRPQWTHSWESSFPSGVSPNTAPPYAAGSDVSASFGHDFRTLGTEARTFGIAEPEIAAVPAPSKNMHRKASDKKKLSIKSVRTKVPNPSSPGWCSVCQRNCVTEVALRQHLEGKPHKKQVERQALTAEAVLKSSNEDGKGVANILEKMWLQVSMIGKPAKSTKKKTAAPLVVPPKVMEMNERLRCDLCNIECNSNTLLEIHFGGRKHAARLKKFQESEIACSLSQMPSMTQAKVLPQTGRASQDGAA